VIWFCKLTVLLGGKNFGRKTLVHSSHVVTHSSHVVTHTEGKEWSHDLALSLNEKGNNSNLIASVETPLSFSTSHTSKNTERCRLGSPSEVPLNWYCCTIEIRADLSSKLWAPTLAQVILEEMPCTPRLTKSRGVLLWSSPPPLSKRLLEFWLLVLVTSTSFS